MRLQAAARAGTIAFAQQTSRILRTCWLADADRDAPLLGFAEDRFVASVVGPQQKIKAAERELAFAEASRPGYAALLYGLEPPLTKQREGSAGRKAALCCRPEAGWLLTRTLTEFSSRARARPTPSFAAPEVDASPDTRTRSRATTSSAMQTPEGLSDAFGSHGVRDRCVHRFFRPRGRAARARLAP